MSFFRTTASRGSRRVSALRRAGAVALAALALPALGMPSAAAHSAATITLDPTNLEFTVTSQPQQVGPVSGSFAVPSPVAAAYGGSITFTVPPQLTIPVGGPGASLELKPQTGSAPSRTYSTSAAAPADRLTLTQVSGRTYRLNLPADDGVHGPVGVLKITSLTSAIAGVVFVDPWTVYPLELSATGPAAVELPAQVLGHFSAGPASTCRLCDAAVVATIPAGDIFQVALPAGTKADSLGIPDLSSSAFSFTSDETEAAANGPSTLLPFQPMPGARAAQVIIPSSTKPGRYAIVVVIGDGTGKVVVTTSVVVRVTAERNAGLLSDTGWDGHSPTAVGTRLSPLVPVGVGMMVVAGLAATAVLVRGRRRRVAED